MTGLPEEKLEKLIERWATIQSQLSAGDLDQTAFAKLSKEFAELDPVVTTIHRYRQAVDELAETREMLEGGEVDTDMIALAREEQATLQERIETLEQEIRLQLLPKDAADDKSAILGSKVAESRF